MHEGAGRTAGRHGGEHFRLEWVEICNGAVAAAEDDYDDAKPAHDFWHALLAAMHSR